MNTGNNSWETIREAQEEQRKGNQFIALINFNPDPNEVFLYDGQRIKDGKVYCGEYSSTSYYPSSSPKPVNILATIALGKGIQFLASLQSNGRFFMDNISHFYKKGGDV